MRQVRSGYGAILAVALGLGACGNPGERFFALEREYIGVLRPVMADPPAATRALCGWFRENKERIAEVHSEYEAYRRELRARRDEVARAFLSALQEENRPLFQDGYDKLLEAPGFFEVASWYDRPSEPLPGACAAR